MADSLEQLELLNMIQQLSQQFEMVEKTFFLFDIYSVDNIRSLQNLHAISSKILFPQVEIKVNKVGNKKVTKYFHEVNPEDFLNGKDNTIVDIPYEDVGNSKFEQYRAIKVYTSIYKNQKIRLVAIPLCDIFKKSDGIKMTEQIKAIDVERYKAGQYLLDQAQKKTVAEKFTKFKQDKQKQFNSKQTRNHLKMFKLESIISILAKKTKQISIGRLLEFGQQKLKEAIQETKLLFNYPNNLKPQYIYHLVDEQIDLKAGSEDDVNSPSVSTAFGYQYEEEKVLMLKGGRDEIFSDRYFSKSNEISTNIYKIMNENNAYMANAISRFVKNWSNIIKQAISPIEPVLRCIYENIFTANYPQTDSVFLPNSSKKVIEAVDKVYRYEEVFASYQDLQKIQLNTIIDEKMQYTIDLQEISKLYEEDHIFQREQKEPSISKQIEGITFLHYFSKANKRFLDNFRQYDKNKNKYSEFIDLIGNYLIQITNLVACVNDTILSEEAFRQNRCRDLQKYTKFMKFLFKQAILIDKITHLSVAVTSFIKCFFEGLLFTDTWFYSYIMAKEKNLLPNQTSKYYDLLLKFIQEDCTMEYFTKIQDIYLTIHKYKADKISQEIPKEIGKPHYQFTAKVAEAIKSYCIFILGYDKLSPQYQKKTDKVATEKKVARLLLLIDQAQEAVKIYQRNHFVTKVDCCFKQIILNYSGDARTNKLIQFGAYFENQFFYVEARWYYQKAYDCALSKEGRRNAQICVAKCRENQNNERKLDVALIKAYTEKGGSEEEFLATNFGQIKNDIRLQAKSHYEMLKNKTQWGANQKELGKSILLSNSVKA